MSFLIPGYLTYNLFRKNKEDTLFEFTYILILISFILTSILLLILTQLNIFSLKNILLLQIIYSIILFSFNYYKKMSFNVSFNSSHTLENITFITIILMCILLFFHPTEEASMYHDVGVHINMGVNIATTGSCNIYDPIMDKMPQDVIPVFYRMYSQSLLNGYQFPGISIDDPDLGKMRQIRPPLHITWLALFYVLFGYNYFLYLSPLLATLSIIAIYLFGKELFNWKVGALGSSLLATNYANVYFAQYSSPEILFQFIFFSGLLLYAYFIRKRNPIFGIISALCFGLLFFIRFDAIFILPTLIIYYIYLKFCKKIEKIHLYFIIPLLIIFLYYVIYVNLHMKKYIYAMSPNMPLFDVSLLPIAYTSLFLFVILFFIFLIIPILKMNDISKFKNKENTIKITKFARYIFLLLFMLWLSYLFIISPNTDYGEGFKNIQSLTWFMTIIGLILGLLATITLIIKTKKMAVVIFLSLFFTYFFYYITSLHNNPVYPWAMRRYITVVIPSLSIFIGYILFEIKKVSFKGKILACSLVVFLIMSNITMNNTQIQPQFEGYIDKVGELSEFFDDRSIIISYGVGTDVAVSLPLKYMFNKNAIFLWTSDLKQFYLLKDTINIWDNNIEFEKKFSKMVDIWEKEDYRIYLITPTQERFNTFYNKVYKTIKVEHINNFSFDISKIRWDWGKFTNTRINEKYTLEIFELRIKRDN